VVDFKNTVIIMTSNLGSHLIQQMAGEEPERVKGVVWQEVKQHFRPEFLNRIDEVVIFHALAREQIKGIARIQLQRLEERLGKLELGFEISDEALERIANAGYDPTFGARPLKRYIQAQLENPLAKRLLAGGFVPKQTVKVGVVDSEFVFST
jgi:ATP-dependent Clp protease ATP-binding subunit ClpB